MPAKNRIKTYLENGIYHIYNRGVAKSEIFKDTQDHGVFLKYLKEALDSPQIQGNHIITFSLRGRSFKAEARKPKNFKEEINLLAYCLMPNHFHLLIEQLTKDSMQSFMRSISTRYAAYFNKKYNRVGPLFQGRYQAILVAKDEYLIHVSRYIHLNPFEFEKDITKAYSSYPEYLHMRNTTWVKPDKILAMFTNPTVMGIKKINNYKDFVEKYKVESSEILGEMVLDS
ncbi:transposase [Candidatus Woesebacteria bacterium]|nr:transposase [Candidatus Woesebacteria bacterium]